MFVVYDPSVTSPAPVGNIGSANAPNPQAILILTTSEQGLIIANDPLSIQVDLTTSPVSVVSNPNFWSIRGPFYIAQQSAIVGQGYLGAIMSPYAFTNAAGVASTYAMDPTSQFIYSQAFMKYVQNAQPLPSGFTIRDANGIPQAFTVADIQNLYNGYSDYFQKCNASFDTLEAEIKSSTSYAQCTSYVWVAP